MLTFQMEKQHTEAGGSSKDFEDPNLPTNLQLRSQAREQTPGNCWSWGSHVEGGRGHRTSKRVAPAHAWQDTWRVAWGGPWPTHVCAMTLISAHCAQRPVVLAPFQVRRKYLSSKV